MPPVSPLILALGTGLFTYFMTAVGAAAIHLKRNPSQHTLDVLLGFSAGVMLAASFWSLLAPSAEIAREQGGIVWLPTALGFAVGGLGLWGLDKVMPHAHELQAGAQVQEGIPTKLRRSTLFVLAITLHHIPEGLAIGVAAGAAASGASQATVGGALVLALGLGLQNLPEGLAVSALLLREGQSRRSSFFWGQITGSVEPVAAVIGALLVGISTTMLPFGLAFAAGAMIYIVVEELVPECQRCGHADSAVLATVIGFTLMTVLDLALG